jgi:hypothetical protein
MYRKVGLLVTVQIQSLHLNRTINGLFENT